MHVVINTSTVILDIGAYRSRHSPNTAQYRKYRKLVIQKENVLFHHFARDI